VSAIVVVSGVRLPEVPVMVTVAGPAVAEAPAVNVRTLVEVAGFVPNAAVTPVGRPVATSVTLPVNPLLGTTVIVLVAPAAPGVIVRVLGESVRVKLGAGVTVSAIVVVSGVRLPEVPVMVTVAVPAEAEAPAVSVSVLVVVVVLGTKTAETPVGNPEAIKVTPAVNPLDGITVIVLVFPASVGVIVRLLGFADRVKFGAAVTVRETVVVAVKLPEVPVTVTVDVPATAVPPAVRVRTLVLVVGFVANAALTPVGKPDAAR